jgi:glycerophosphoryl diester phosphodiesterase
MEYAGARDVWPEWNSIDEQLVARVHAAGGRVIAWTVNDREAAVRLAALGVDGVCTDDVRLLDDL